MSIYAGLRYGCFLPEQRIDVLNEFPISYFEINTHLMQTMLNRSKILFKQDHFGVSETNHLCDA